jgi:hypothetical protein
VSLAEFVERVSHESHLLSAAWHDGHRTQADARMASQQAPDAIIRNPTV